MFNCQSSDVVDLQVRDNGTIVVTSQDDSLVYTPYSVTAPDGTEVAHESRGGSLVGAWSTRVGDAFVEISYLGDGPQGGELVMVVSDASRTHVALGALARGTIPAAIAPSWPAAVDLALGLVVDTTLDSGTKDDVDRFHQRLLAVAHEQ